MKSLWQPRKNRAFTLVEMLVVIAIIAILAALLLPVLSGGKKRAQRIQCIGNLNQIGTAFQIFAHDHQGNFPMQVSEADGGSQEFARGAETRGGTGFFYSWRHFFPLANDLTTPKPLVCPADLARVPVESFRQLRNSNLSYAVNIDANYNAPESILSTDRNITNNVGDVTMMPPLGLTWTRELHYFKGNVLFSDSHVEQWNTVHFSVATNTALFLPTIPPTTLAGDPGSPGSPGSPPSTGSSGPPPVTSPGGSSPPTSPAGSSGGPSSSPGSSGGASTSSSTSSTSSSSNSRSAASNASTQNAGQPSPQMPAPYGRTASSSSAPGSRGSNALSYFDEVSAKEKKRGTATNVVANPLAAPPVEDYQPPLARLFGAASPDGSSSHGWLWLLLALLIALAGWVYYRWKKSYENERDE